MLRKSHEMQQVADQTIQKGLGIALDDDTKQRILNENHSHLADIGKKLADSFRKARYVKYIS